MKMLKFLTGLLLLLSISVRVTFAKDFPLPIQKKLKTEVAKLVRNLDIPGINIGIWIPTQGEWVQSLGTSNKDTNKKINLHDHFRIGSITKTFVVTAILQLVDKGKISLDDPISQYIDNVPSGEKITIRSLANMTSGLANYSENNEWSKETIYTKNNRNVAAQELLDVAFKMPKSFAPGKGWQYSNTNTILLGQVIEKVSGLNLAQYLQQNIFAPLELNNTSYPMDEKIPPPYAHGYTKQTLNGKEEDRTFNSVSWTNAAGQMISTFDDLKIWAKVLGTGALLNEKTFKEQKNWVKIKPNTPQRSYGLGVATNNGWIMHSGKLPGYNCIIAYLPEKEAIFVVMINSDIDYEVNKKEIALADLVFEAVAKIATPGHVPIN